MITIKEYDKHRRKLQILTYTSYNYNGIIYYCEEIRLFQTLLSIITLLFLSAPTSLY